MHYPGGPSWIRELAFDAARPVPEVQVAEIPVEPGAYSLWTGSGSLIYVGLAGVRWSAERPSPTSTLRQRLRDHLSAHRADVLTSYLFERVAVDRLSERDRRAMLNGSLTIRDLVLEALATMRVAWTVTGNYREAKVIEDACRSGSLGEAPLINPLSVT